MQEIFYNKARRKRVIFDDKDDYPLYSQGGSFPLDRYNAKEEGLLYFKHDLELELFNGPFYGFTPASDPNGNQFVPELFFVHGPTYVEEGRTNGEHLRTFLCNKEAKQRLLEAINKVFSLRYSDLGSDGKYQMEMIPPQSTINILWRDANRAKTRLIEYINKAQRQSHYLHDNDTEEYCSLMAAFDTTTKALEEACEKRDAHIRQMNTHNDLLALQTKHASDFNALSAKFDTLSAKFDTISETQNDLKQILLQLSNTSPEVQEELKGRLDSIDTFIAGVGLGEKAIGGTKNGPNKEPTNGKH